MLKYPRTCSEDARRKLRPRPGFADGHAEVFGSRIRAPRARSLDSGSWGTLRVTLQAVTVGGPWLPVLFAVGQFAAATPPPEPTAIRIEFEAPSGCSSVDAFYEGVHSRTNRVRWAVEGEGAVQIRIRLFRAGTKIKGELRLSDQEGEKETRKVDGDTCDEVVEALALTVTLALDPSALFSSKVSNGTPGAMNQSSPGATAPGAMGPNQPRAAPLKVEQALEPPKAARFELGAAFMAANVISTGVSVGPAIVTRVIVPRTARESWSLDMTLLHAQDNWLRAAERGTFSLSALQLALCPLRSSLTSRVDVALCVDAMGGWLRASGLAFAHTNTVSRSWWSAGLQGSSSLRLVEELRLELTIGGDTPLIRRQFTINEPPESFAASPWLVFRGSAGLAYRF